MKMDRLDRKTVQRREYPAMYEKAVPIALAVIGISIIILLGVIVAVALRLAPFAA